MKLYIAKGAGFCFGVKRAIDIAFKVAQEHKGGVYTLGPIIHNPQVIEELKTMGVHPVKNVSSLRGKKVGAVIVRTHGVTRQVMDSLVSKGYNVIDATCPYVKKAQYYAKLLKDEGYQVVVLGSKEHPEVKGIMSFAEKGAVVVKDASELPKLKQKVGVVVQTTRHVDSLKELLGAIVGQIRELKVYNTLCSSTTLRLKETEELARKVDVMVIVGGKNSANTTQLANLCRSLNVSTHHIETASELRKKWFAGAKRVAISAGASTPDRLINDVKRKINLIGGRVVDGS
jgi:4-hydroxy-3-methylbut-2-enyl diphosphate reductase